MKVIFATPTIKRPFDPYIASLERSVPAVEEAGFEHQAVFRVGDVYISHSRAFMLRQALEAGADLVVFIDHDLSWTPADMVRLLTTPGEVVAGTYRYKQDEERYMGTWLTDEAGHPVVRDDGTVVAHGIPAGFLKVTRGAVEKFRAAYPELVFGPEGEFVDLFNHGAHKGLWWGEDFAFSRRWKDLGGEIRLIPDLDLAHHLPDGSEFPGNFHDYLLRQPGGSREGKAPKWQ